MLTSRISVLSVLFLHLIVAQGWGQASKEVKPEPRRAMPRGGLSTYTPERLLEMPAVRREIKTTPDQVSRLNALKPKADAIYKQEGEQYLLRIKTLGENPAPDQVAAVRRERMLSLRSLTDEIDVTYLKLLNRSQRDRLLQIRLQLEGPTAFLNPDFQERLNLSPEQGQQIREVISVGRAQLGQVDERSRQILSQRFLPVPDEGKPADSPQVRQIDPSKKQAVTADMKTLAKNGEDRYKAIMQGIEKILSRRQHENYHKMLGTPFDPSKPPAEPTPDSKPPAKP